MMHTPRGYTLLEMIVAVGVFSVVMLAATGAYLNLIRFDRETRAVNEIVTNISFVTDTMAREIRTGSGYKCNNNASTPNCTASAGTSFGFTDSQSRSVRYYVSAGQIYAEVTTGGITTTSAITDARVTVESLQFYVRGVGTDTGDGTAYLQPQVVFSLRGSIVTGPNRSLTFSVQSAATQRYLELP